MVSHWRVCVFFCRGSTAQVDLGLLCEVPRSHSDTPHSVGLLWTRDRPVVNTTTWQHTIIRDRHPRPRRDSNPQSQQASGSKPTTETAGDIVVNYTGRKAANPADVALRLWITVFLYCSLQSEVVQIPRYVYGSDIPSSSHLLLLNAREQNDSVQIVLTTRLHLQLWCFFDRAS